MRKPLRTSASNDCPGAPDRNPPFLKPLWRLGFWSGLAWLTVALFAGCGERVPEETVVARIDGETLTVEDFERWAEWTGRRVNAESREAHVKAFVTFSLQVRNAKEEGLDEDPEMRFRFKRMLARAMEEREESGRVEEMESPGEKELEAMYEKHRDEFRIPERVRVAVIFIDVPEAAERGERRPHREKLEAVRGKVSGFESGRDPGHFGEFAVRYSHHHPSRYAGGDLGWWFSDDESGEWDDDIREAAFGLEERGEVSEVLDARDGLYLLRLIERDEARYRPFESVRPQLLRKSRMAREDEREKERRKQLREGLDISVYPERLLLE